MIEPGYRRLCLWIVVGLLGSALLTRFAVWPLVSRLPSSFAYKAVVESYDNLYSVLDGKFSGEQSSIGTFYLTSHRVDWRRSLVKSFFSIVTAQGEQVFAVERLYGIDRLSWQHLEELGDSARSGYLFGPRGGKPEQFIYWHVNYNRPIHLRLKEQQTLMGLETLQYADCFQANQTDELRELGVISEDEEMDIAVCVDVWIDPRTGWLVKYRDKARAVIYNATTGQKVRPWNHFRNEFSEATVRLQAAKANRLYMKEIVFGRVVPLSLLVCSLPFVFSLMTRRR